MSWVTKLAHDDTGRLYHGDYDIYNFFVRNRQEETKTTFGRNEANNPFLYVTVPKALRNTDMFKVLKSKENELITPHDIHATLKDILEEQPSSNFLDISYKSFLPLSRGSSLLREFEPGVVRNCKTLPIPSQYCICQYAKTALEYVCGSMWLTREASQLMVHSVMCYILPEAQRKTTAIYDVTFQVSPSAGLFQVWFIDCYF
ncbi:unnamed protein product [Heligmosomoides polygyrus]|uniref:Uncharacterized protein n=1 Tax=Heligmosomoides polygyrus TaxID=6339 RepID=A0A3P7XKT7_HELPZ|nr:unnamed protein product [Heligmosomoides polygyrus]